MVQVVRRVTLLTAPVLALLLAACGSSGPRPGTALELDGQRVSTRHVDDVASRYCRALSKIGQSVTRQAVRTQVVGAMAARLIGERFAEAQGVKPGAAYEQQLRQLKSQIGQFDQKTQDAIVEVEGSQYFVNAVIRNGGEQAFTKWLADQHVVVNPVYGLDVDAGRFAHHDASLSVAASGNAKSAVQAASDPSAAPAPGSPTCG